MKTTVIHHSSDFDGIFCREIARKFLPDAELIGWDFGDKKINRLAYPLEHRFVVLDLPVDRPFGEDFSKDPVGKGANWKNWIWIDHHASSIASHPTDIPGYRIDGVAACRLAWQWFVNGTGTLPQKHHFVNRTVTEPLAILLAGEYDIWDKRDPRAELFQFGLKSQPLTDDVWRDLLDTITFPRDVPNVAVGDIMVGGLLESGKPIAFAREQEYRDVITQQGFDLQFEGLTFLACNSHELDIRSQLFEAGIKPHHDALLGFTFHGKGYRVSLYRIPWKDTDILSIARKHGGGGHAGACGFQLNSLLPFMRSGQGMDNDPLCWAIA